MSKSNDQTTGAAPSVSTGQPGLHPVEPPAPGPATGQAPTPATGFDWQEHLRSVGAWISGKFSQPRVRLCLIGVVLLLLGGLGVASSMWTLPVMIVGALMVVIAWIGSRLNGRFAVEWGETGTQLEFRAKINAPAPAQPALSAPGAGTAVARPVAPASPFRVAQPPEPEPDVIEGHAHTVEIDVAELKALIAVAEAQEAEAARTAAASPAGSPPDRQHRPAA